MNQYVKAVEAALRATAPFVAIPVEGHAPACVRAKLLKGALRGVTITSVKILTDDGSGNRWLHIQGIAGELVKGRATSNVRTSCKMTVINVKCSTVWDEMRKWTNRERDKRIKVINQGILNPAERKALKLKEAIAKEEKRRNAELIEAQEEEAEIIAEAKGSIVPVITPLEPEERALVTAEYAQFRACRHVRKRGSVIRWKLAKLRERVKEMTVEKREYAERESGWGSHRRRRYMTGSKTVLRRQKDKLEYMAVIYQIGQLEAQFKPLYPDRHVESDYVNDGRGYFIGSFQEKRPHKQAYIVPWNWHDGCVGGTEEYEEPESDGEGGYYAPVKRLTGIRRLAERLRVARANVRSLTPPTDEDDGEQMDLAA